jgi:hypothetical protein
VNMVANQPNQRFGESAVDRFLPIAADDDSDFQLTHELLQIEIVTGSPPKPDLARSE